MLYLLSTSCVLTLAYSTLFPLGDTLLLLGSCRREGVRSALPGLRGLLGVRLSVDVPVAPYFRELLVYVFTLPHTLYQTFVINVINNIRIRFIISFYVICVVIYCSFYCIYIWLDLGTYIIARFMSFDKPGVTLCLRRELATDPRSLSPGRPIGKQRPGLDRGLIRSKPLE